ncbi:hypothetical protein PHLGIDRAFT_296430 [Phlebiopsis gigantea 11061_1 CR5-6]|uniref:Uncharacterized protein n=1 Tax=Phlebiopsis gigantea (strain 11061_1 CR5-6) TaxID=745531 RepID=A0A0C3NWU7_PHLG1|nr:hypothetical protein PHLGIDRAFT_296430 [Phlebiopsis gigantea 11061_1 CR5-6]
MAVQNGIKVYRVLQARPELAAIVLAAGKHSLSHDVNSIKLSDWNLLKAAGLTSLDFLEANEAVGSALNVVLWGPPNSEKESKSWRPFHNFTWKKRWLFEALRRFFRLDEWFANYNKALMVLSLEAVNEVKTGTSFYHETLQDPYIIDHLRKVGKYLISIGIKDDGTIPSITVSRENDALSAKLHALHQHMQLKNKCPVGLLANMRKMQREVGFPCIGNDDWEKIDANHLSLFKKIT